MKKLLVLIVLISLTIPKINFAQPTYFYPNAGKMNAQIPTPESFLGYSIGSHHTRHDKIVEYFKELDRLSDRVSLQVLGETFEHRQQIAVIFTSPENHKRLGEIRTNHLAGQLNGNTAAIPLVIHLGYNVHGNEPSSSEAAMLTGYYLTASENSETIQWLKDMVILMDPVINPDGRDRHTQWANMHKADPLVADPLDREHTEVWPGGRFNHYWFDLNRDWYLAVFPETRNRIRFFHEWRPYVQTDHHEMQTNSTFYFDPGKSSSNNPIVPDFLYNHIYPKFGRYFSEATNQIGSLYYTKESFDKLYPGYGSSYINFYGGAGFLFEQGSSRGHLQETSTIPLSFPFTIRNQFVTSLATMRASVAEKSDLLKLRKDFYRAAEDQYKRSRIKAYVYGDAQDETRTRAFTELLLIHQIEVHELNQAVTTGGKKFEPGKAFIVPVEQSNYLMVKSIFEKDIPYTDSTFYDASTWNLTHAYNLPFSELGTTAQKGKKLTGIEKKPGVALARSNYAYVAKATDYNIHQAIYQLQKRGVIIQSAFRPFTLMVNNQAERFGYGSISVPVSLQNLSSDSIFSAIKTVSGLTGIYFFSIQSGFNTEGIDLGSNYMRTIKKPEVVMLVGGGHFMNRTGASPTEAGEVWHLLDQRLQMPITKMEISNLPGANLNRYNVMVMVTGFYNGMDKASTDKIKTWVQNGGCLITFKTATEWAIRQGLTKEKIIPPFDTSKTTQPKRFNFDNAVEIEGAQSLGGSIFSIDLDTTHPIGFGFTSRKVSVYKNGLTYLMPSSNPYSTVAQFTNNPLVGGYVHSTTLKKLSNSAAIIVAQEGNGKLIMFTDNPNFRGTWYGTNKLFLNALFYGPIITVPEVR